MNDNAGSPEGAERDAPRWGEWSFADPDNAHPPALRSGSRMDESAGQEGTWPAGDIRRAFVAGAAWWEYTKEGATIWQSDRAKAEAEAERRYPGGTPTPTDAPRDEERLIGYEEAMAAAREYAREHPEADALHRKRTGRGLGELPAPVDHTDALDALERLEKLAITGGVLAVGVAFARADADTIRRALRSAPQEDA